MTIEMTARPRLWYHGWNIVAVCILSQVAANALTVNAFTLFLQSWSKELHAPVSTFLLGMASCGMVASLLSPFVGVMADKYPARWLFGAGLAVTAFVCLGVSVVTAVWQFVALYALFLPVALCFAAAVPANAVVSRWFVKRLGLALGLSSFGLGMAGVVLPPIIAAVMPLIGWRTIWQIAGLFIGLVALPLVVWVTRDRPTESEGQYYMTRDGATTAYNPHGGGKASGLGWRDVLTRRNFWLLVIFYLPMLGLYGGIGQNLAPLSASRGLSQEAAGTLLSIFSFAHLAATLLVGLLSDRFGNRLPIVGLAVTATVGGLIVTFGQNPLTIGLGVILVGAGGGFWPLLAAGLSVEFGASGVGRAFGMATLFIPVAVLTPFAVAKTQESIGSYTPALLALSALALLGGLVCLLLREKRGGHRSPEEHIASEEVAVPLA